MDKKLQDLENQQKQLLEGTEEWNQLDGEIQDLRSKQKNSFQGRKHLAEYREMLLQMESMMPNIMQLLGSKNQNDVVETILAHQDGLYVGGTFTGVGETPSVGLGLWRRR